MRERERGIRVGGAGGGDLLQHHHALPSKPNISLLPTAVMRQLHNSKPTHSVSAGSVLFATLLRSCVVCVCVCVVCVFV